MVKQLREFGLVGLTLVVSLIAGGTAQAAPFNLRFTEIQMPIGSTGSVVQLDGDEYTDFGISTTNLYRYHDARDPFSDGAENQDGNRPYGVAPTIGGALPGRIDFLAPVSNLSIDWWTINGTMFIDVFNSSGVLLGSTSGIGPLTSTFVFQDIGFFTFHDSGGFVLVSNIRFDQEAIPEPATLLLLGSGLGAAAVRLRRRRSA